MTTVTFQLVTTVCHAQTTLHILKLTYNEIKYKMLLRNVLFLGDLSLTSRHLARKPRFRFHTKVCELVAVKNAALKECLLSVLQIPLSVSFYQFPILINSFMCSFVTHGI